MASKMKEERKKYVKTNTLIKKLLDREDNLYKKEVLEDVVALYSDELVKLLKNGDAVQIAGLGVIRPKPRITRCSLDTIKDDNQGRYYPSVPLIVSLTSHFRREINSKFRANIRRGYPGLGKALCNEYQQSVLLKTGFMDEPFVEEDVMTDDDLYDEIYDEIDDYGEEDY